MNTVGGILRSQTTLVSTDGAHVFVASGSTVRVYSTATGERLLCLTGHAADVTAICRHAKSESQIYTASLDGTIKLWDYAEAAVQQTWTVGELIESMVLPSKQVALLSCRWGAAGAGRVHTYSFVQKRVLQERALKLSAPAALVSSPNAAFAAAIDRNSVVLICLEQPHAKPITLHHTKPLTCLAIDSTSSHIAAGDSKGRILIWSGLQNAAAAAASGDALDARTAGMTVATIHWHAHAVGALAFSPDGLYLLSGGREAVLVIWQLETLKRSYLPRLGGPITHISACVHDGARYAVCQENNAVRMVAISTMKVECSMYGVRPPPLGASPEVGTASATCQPGSGYLVMPCMGAQLQFYDVSKDRHIARHSVVPRNLVSLTESTTSAEPSGLQEPAVTLTAFSHDATVMATLEVRPAGGAAEPSTALKFWEADAAAVGPAAYTVNTVVEAPHGGPVASLAFHPGEFVAVTAGTSYGSGEGEFRVWLRQPHKRAPGSPASAPAWHWRCRSVGSYKGLPMRCCAFSPDGSLLAVAAGPHITLWHPATNALMAVLPGPSCCAGSPIKRLIFSHHSPHIIAACGSPQPHLLCWNLLTFALCWAVAVDTIDIAWDPLRPRFTAVLATDKEDASLLVEMGVDAPEAVRTWCSTGVRVCKVLYPPPGSALCSRARAVARTGGSVPAIAIAEDRRMMMLPERSGELDRVSFDDDARLRSSAPKKGGGYAAIYGEMPAVKDVKREGEAVSAGGKQPQAALASLFDVPSHLLPSTTVLCGQMLQMMLASSHADAL